MALTKFNFNSFDLTTVASSGLAFNSSANGFTADGGGAMTLIKTLTASDDSTISFVHGSSDVVLDSTYPVYLFKLINVHPSSGNATGEVNFRDGGSAYDATKTTTFFRTSHRDNDTEVVFGTNGSSLHSGGGSLGQDTGTQQWSGGIGGGAGQDEHSGSGYVYLFNPSSTTFVKHFMIESQIYSAAQSEQSFAAGYCNTTAAIDGVQFSFSSGNIGAGTFKLYGIKDS